MATLTRKHGTMASSPSAHRGCDRVTARRPGTGALDRARGFGGDTRVAPQTADGAVSLVDSEGTAAHAWTLPVRPGRHAVPRPDVWERRPWGRIAPVDGPIPPIFGRHHRPPVDGVDTARRGPQDGTVRACRHAKEQIPWL